MDKSSNDRAEERSVAFFTVLMSASIGFMLTQVLTPSHLDLFLESELPTHSRWIPILLLLLTTLGGVEYWVGTNILVAEVADKYRAELHKSRPWHLFAYLDLAAFSGLVFAIACFRHSLGALATTEEELLQRIVPGTISMLVFLVLGLGRYWFTARKAAMPLQKVKLQLWGHAAGIVVTIGGLTAFGQGEAVLGLVATTLGAAILLGYLLGLRSAGNLEPHAQ